MMADAIDQVLAATVHEATVPVLNAVYLEVAGGSVTLTATDRYRLTTRTLTVSQLLAEGLWSVTLSGDDLRATVAEIRRSARIVLTSTPRSLDVELSSGVRHRGTPFRWSSPTTGRCSVPCPGLTHRVTATRQHLVRVLGQVSADHVGLRLSLNPRSVELRIPGAPALDLPAQVDGEDLMIWSEITTLYPAILQAVGPDVMLDLRGPDQPITVRSADNGVLSTLVMPIAAPEPTHAHHF